MKKIWVQFVVSAAILAIFAAGAYAHCEIPCGIYDDALRIKLLNEHIATIEKSMNQIMKLEKEDHINWNQLVRWITNKEQHAEMFQEIVTQYFMTQRIKPGMNDYEPMLALLHEMLVYSMKCKQTVDIQNVEKLKSLVADFDKIYSTRK